MIFQKTKTLKTSFFFLAFAALLLVSVLFYNQGNKRIGDREVMAEEAKVTLVCDGEEIPLGDIMAESFQMGDTIENNTEIIMKTSTEQVSAAEQLYRLPEQCTDANCTTNCHEHCHTDIEGTTHCTCDMPTCGGDACPWGAISTQVSKIESLYNTINNSKRIIDETVAKRPDLIQRLNAVRAELAKCVTPGSLELEEGEIKDAKALYTCQEAKLQRALPEDKEDCHPNNLFCCYFE